MHFQPNSVFEASDVAIDPADLFIDASYFSDNRATREDPPVQFESWEAAFCPADEAGESRHSTGDDGSRGGSAMQGRTQLQARTTYIRSHHIRRRSL